MSASILIVEDEKLLRWSLTERLSEEGYATEQAATAAEAREAIEDGSPDLVLLDMRLPDGDGLSLIPVIQEACPRAMIILMTAYSSVQDAVEAIKLGAYDYIDKPFDMDALVLAVAKALETTALRREVRHHRDRQKEEYGFSNIIGEAPEMERVFRLVQRVAESGASTVLITGESGTGKDLVAKAIHYQSARADGPFLNITCTAITETLLESELFGHEKGAFTDARARKEGLFELADGGSVFLDEIGDLPLALQAKILRFLEEKTFRRVGGTRDIMVDVRIVAATNRDLTAMVDDGSFREDLYYRLNVIPIGLPPLRNRRGDIPLLAAHFIEEFNREFGKDVDGITSGALAILREYPWPGNVRELRNVVERAMILGRGDELGVEDLPYEMTRPGEAEGSSGDGDGRSPGFLLPAEGLDMEDLERSLVVQALRRTQGNKTRASSLLGMNRDQIRYRIDKFDVDDEEYLPEAELA